MMERIRTLVDQLVDERSRLHRQELAALQAQINPHFLYNTLEIVNWMAIERGAGDIASIVRALSDMMRYAIGNGAETAAASEELSYVERYLSLQSFRFPDKFETRINASDEARRCGMPKLCLQPIVENSVQHAFKGLRRKGTVSVSLDIEGNDLVAIIADDGNGMDRETLDRLLTEKHDGSGIETTTRKADHAGIGVSNVDLRLKLRYGKAYGLSYVSAPGEGTTCTLRIPANGGTV
jgi:two-component system sensor histidine kinase YesM